ncbi:MAG TPA: TOBE domain-containing protein [Advenella sp.]|nr:TOBE domain-containing protein [Advenella sp.]
MPRSAGVKVADATNPASPQDAAATAGGAGPRLNVRTAIGFGLEQRELADERDLQLLGHVQRLGSITAAARAAGVTYKTAWDRLRNLQTRLGQAVIIAAKGGRGGGRTQLSETGQALLQYYEQLRRQQDHAVEPDVELDAVGGLAARPLPLRKTSARNHLQGVVAAIERDGIRDAITVRLHDAMHVNVNITHASTLALGLKKGVAVYLLIKAPAIRFARQQPVQQNVFCGSIRNTRRVQEQQELEVQIAPDVCLITVAGQDQPAPLRKGDRIWVHIDPDTVILGVD